MKQVRVIILRTAGTNCDQETVFAFKTLGALVDLVHIKKLFSATVKLEDYHILVIPGGFSYGDDIASGRILANELRLRLGEDIKRFIGEGKLIIGICNGFQVLVKAGVLPGSRGNSAEGSLRFLQEATLTTNDSARFEDRWVYLKPEGRCVWTMGIKDIIYLPVAHGEGKFVVWDESIQRRLQERNQIAFRYCSPSGGSPRYPENPNGSLEDIAAITDESGRILGLMPHPERHFLGTHHPRWTRLEKKSEYGDGARILANGINYANKKFL